MQNKDIKTQTRKQRKKRYPNWNNLTKKEKKQILQKVMDEVVANYDFPKTVTTPISELIGLSGQKLTKGIMTIKQMSEYLENYQSCVLLIYTLARFSPRNKRCRTSDYRSNT